MKLVTLSVAGLATTTAAQQIAPNFGWLQNVLLFKQIQKKKISKELESLQVVTSDNENLDSNDPQLLKKLQQAVENLENRSAALSLNQDQILENMGGSDVETNRVAKLLGEVQSIKDRLNVIKSADQDTISAAMEQWFLNQDNLETLAMRLNGVMTAFINGQAPAELENLLEEAKDQALEAKKEFDEIFEQAREESERAEEELEQLIEDELEEEQWTEDPEESEIETIEDLSDESEELLPEVNRQSKSASLDMSSDIESPFIPECGKYTDSTAKFPWLVDIKKMNPDQVFPDFESFCTALILDKTHLVASFSCFNSPSDGQINRNFEDIQVHVPSSLSKNEKALHTISGVISQASNKLNIIRLAEEIQFREDSDQPRPICLNNLTNDNPDFTESNCRSATGKYSSLEGDELCLGKFSPLKKSPERLIFCKNEENSFYLSANSAFKAAACGIDMEQFYEVSQANLDWINDVIENN